jgi:hypothetical protein
MMKTIALSTISLAIFLGDVHVVHLSAQEANVASDNKSNWLDAVKLLDNQSSEDAKHGETLLRQELARSETPVEAAWALTLFCIKRSDWVATEKVLKAIETRYPNPPTPVLVALERIKLSVALAQGDKEAGEAAFKKIAATATNTSIAKEDRQLSAASIGAIVGMLQVDAARSSIAKELLDQVRDTLTAITKDDISPQFQFGYQSSESKAGLLSEKLAALETAGIEATQAELQKIMVDRETQNQSVEEAEEALRLAKLNTEEQVKANRLSIKQLQANVAKLEKSWKVPTSGHPGAEKPAPAKPQKYDIVVDEYEFRSETVTETDSNGKQVQRRRNVRVRRPQAEIDRDRDYQYARLMDVYRIRKAEYDEYIVKYRNVLAAWIQADQDRREKLQDDKRANLQRVAELNKQIDDLEAERAVSAKALTEMRRKLKELENEEEILSEVVRAATTQKAERSFRPGFFETVFVEKEKSRLLKSFQESIR